MMLPEINNKVFSARYVSRLFAAAVLVMIFIFAGSKAEAAVNQKVFTTPEEAVKAFAAAMKVNDEKDLLLILGAEAKELISSGDAVKDRQRRDRFIGHYDQKHHLAHEGGKVVLIVGEKDWPFAIPLVKKGGKWMFDTKAGKEEILNRRIGENELNTIQTMNAIVDAQREYAMNDPNNNGILEYAEKFWSEPGKKNGLYWETGEGEEPSPLGKLVAGARAEGYTQTESKQKPTPFQGYYFRMLMKQGEHASRGAFDYIVKSNMIGGFAVVAYPAAHGSSGVMTFVVNHEGVVYEKDLGKNTAQTAKDIKSFDPDKTWKKVE